MYYAKMKLDIKIYFYILHPLLTRYTSLFFNNNLPDNFSFLLHFYFLLFR